MDYLTALASRFEVVHTLGRGRSHPTPYEQAGVGNPASGDDWMTAPAPGEGLTTNRPNTPFDQIVTLPQPTDPDSETQAHMSQRIASRLYQAAFTYTGYAERLRIVARTLQTAPAFSTLNTSIGAKYQVLTVLTTPNSLEYIDPMRAPLAAGVIDGEMARISFRPSSNWRLLYEAAKNTPGDIARGAKKVVESLVDVVSPATPLLIGLGVVTVAVATAYTFGPAFRAAAKAKGKKPKSSVTGLGRPTSWDGSTRRRGQVQ